MIIKYKDEYPNDTEIVSHYCPVCDEFVSKGQAIHECSQEALEKIAEEEKRLEDNDEDDYSDLDRTFDDHFRELELMLDPEYSDFDEDGFL